ncbi:glycerol-3-phosphate responsive antiterminator [Maledivibacter halophilus]|uniref:Glycerol uptake operon antiterminator n=1 Tax=Maledivibacter halophilus TaxID=36842 RepID=A0A1T5MGP4_9FIRM|nr:glycerol-3-phosphate responsive antiterminator [Maledivibacter halophilus]SKC87355.1 glycerol uptake operon antiterminator [Maledivibacter halophilus]
MGDAFFDKIYLNPIIAAVSDIEKLEKAIESPCEIIFLLTGSIFNLKDIVSKIKEKNKSIYIHIDLLDGFSRDIISLKYINDNIKPDGIITTKSNLIKHAKGMGLLTIQRLFMLDSLSLETGIRSIRSTNPDAVEIMPGIMPKVTNIIHNATKIPIIAGGLIMDKEDVIQSLKAGAIGISTSKEEIWDM